MRVGRIHFELPHAVAEIARDHHALGGLEDHRAELPPRGDVPAVHHRVRDPDVVARLHVEPAARRLEARGAVLHVPELVAVAVREVRVVGLGRADEAHGDVAVEEHGDALVDRLAARGDLVRVVEAPLERAERVLGRDRRVEAAVGQRGVARRRDRALVIEGGERAGEALAREHLFVEELSVRVAERGVRFRRQEPREATLDHSPSGTARCSRRARGNSRSRSPCRPRAG